MEFSSELELYNRLVPALETRQIEFNRKNNIVEIEIIWDYLKETMWKESTDLGLADMVSDILNVSFDEILEYVGENNAR